MKAEKQIRKHIKELEASLKGQMIFADINKGDRHDDSRAKAILARQSYLSALKWVLK